MFQSNRKDRIGQLTEKVSVYREITVKDTFGALEIKKQAIVQNRWAKVELKSMSESAEMDKIQFNQAIKVTMRYIDITQNDIIEYEGNFYNVYSFIPMQRKSYIVLEAELITEPTDV